VAEPDRDLLLHPLPPTPEARASSFSEEDLAEQMLAFIETYNQTAKPFKWNYTGKVLEA
jgi:hypothetical protein